MMDQETERRIKMMTQDYEWQTRGIPQRLDQVLYDGYKNGLAQAAQNQINFDAQTDYIVDQIKKNMRNSTYEQVKQDYFSYTKEYNKAVRNIKLKQSIARLITWAFGLGALANVVLGIGSCFIEGGSANAPEIMKPYVESSGMIGMIGFVILGIFWWIMYAIISNAGDPEISGMAGRYLEILNAVENKLKSKKFSKIYKSDPDFFDIEEDEDDYEEEEELYKDEEGNYYADNDPENPKNIM